MIGMYLLDTNIISELGKLSPVRKVTEMISKKQRVSAVPSIVWGECLFGMNRLPLSNRRLKLEDFYLNSVLETFPFIPFDEHAAWIFSDIKSRLERIGKPAPLLDMQIAATAIANNLILVTRNVKDFEPIAEVSALMLENWFD
ncbi:MAG: type II toxin-antitoxin system VapC family toxin [Spirochaetales bacterium]|nr:type II toxin-antitoxin system VapC family toxin [Spirochaetales bacterium]